MLKVISGIESIIVFIIYFNFLILMNHIFSHFVFYKFSSNWGYMFVFGILLLFLFFSQFITGLCLSLLVSNYQYFIKLIHSFGASFLVAFSYIHFYKSLFYRTFSYNQGFTCIFSGIIVLLILLMVCFSGYILP